MTTAAIMNTVSGTVNKIGFKVRKHSPEVLVVSGIVGVVASTVMACKATTKASGIMKETKQNLDMIHDCAADEGLRESGKYTEEDKRRDLTIQYVQTGVKLAKVYGPAIVLGALSITSILASNNILRKRNVALAAAYATIDRTFKDYRKRVIEKLGEAADREFKYGIRKEKVEKTVIDEETGKEKKVKETIEVTDYDGASQYAKFFDECSEYWNKNAELNLTFLRAQQCFANDKLRSQGYLFLNDVYGMLGIAPTQAGQHVGWIYDPKNPDHKGNDYVDFGIYNIHRKENRKFVNGYERSILLDFNVDGDILSHFEA